MRQGMHPSFVRVNLLLLTRLVAAAVERGGFADLDIDFPAAVPAIGESSVYQLRVGNLLAIPDSVVLRMPLRGASVNRDQARYGGLILYGSWPLRRTDYGPQCCERSGGAKAWYALLADLNVKDAVYSLAIAQQYRMFRPCRDSQDSQKYEFQQRG
jgi:hypothetical protein